MVETGDGTGSGGGPTPVRVSELVGTFVADEFGPPVFTPDANLYQGARILVPVDLQALVVEEEDAPLSRQEVSSQPSTDPSEFEPASPFTDGTPLGAGIHLHWAMPDALMKGRAGDLVSDPVSAPHTESPDGPQLRTSEAQVNHSAAEVTHLQPDSEILSAARSGEELPVDSGEEKLSEMFNFLSLPDRWVVYRVAPTPSLPPNLANSNPPSFDFEWQIRGKIFTHYETISHLTNPDGSTQTQYFGGQSLLRLDAHLGSNSPNSGSGFGPSAGWDTADLPFLRPGLKVSVNTGKYTHSGGSQSILSSVTHVLTVESYNHNEVLFEEEIPDLDGEEVWIYPGEYVANSSPIDMSNDSYPALVDAWMIESDSMTVTRLCDYDPSSSTNSGSPMIALGPNEDPMWTLTYDNVKGRFTFHDQSIPAEMKGPLHYLVCGWYDDEEEDPLYVPIGHNRGRWFDILDALKWHVDEDDLIATLSTSNSIALRSNPSRSVSTNPSLTIGENWPRQSLFHGSIIDVEWKGDGGSFNREDIPLDAEFCLGNHPAECLATQLAKNFSDSDSSVTPEEEQQMEEHLASFFMNSLDALTGPDGFYNLQQKIHQTTFKPVSAGYYYDFADKANANSGDPTEIVSYPSPRYYAPSIPSLSILNSRGSTRHGGDGIYTDDGTLQCRFSGQCITGSNAYQSDIVYGIDDSQQFANFSPIPTVNIPVDCSGLFRELLILSFTRANCFSWRGPRMASDLNESWKWWDNLGSEAMNFLQHYICGGDDLFRQCLIAHDKETNLVDILGELTGTSTPVSPALDINGNHLINPSCLGPDGFFPDIRFTGGVLPSPVANNLWSQAWVPMYLDYKIGYCHNVNPADWKLDSEYTRDLNADMFLNSVDYEYMDAAPDPIFGDASEPYGNFPRIVERTPLTRGPGLVASDKLKRVLDDENDLDTLDKGLLEENDEVTLENLKDDLAWMDVLSATLSGFKPLVYSMAGSEGMRGGHGRIEEAVIVDAFGRTQILFQPTNTQSPHLLSLSMGCGDRVYSNEPSWSTPFTLRPRIVQGARVMFRFLSSTDDDQPSNAESDGQNSPVCAFFLPDHVEWSMEVFDSEGSPQGQLRVAERDWTQGGVQSGRLAWDTAPGKPIALGTQPQSGNIHSDALLNQLILSGLDDELDPTREEGVLSALLRAIDTTRWDIDRFGTSGNEHLATFMGHPIAVVRAKVRLEVDERGDGTTSEELLRRIFQIRVGALGKVSDGLLGYFMNDDYTKFHAVYPVHETTGVAVPMEPYQQDLNSENPDIIPLTHPFLYFDPTIELRPNQEVTLTLLMNPLAAVHASSGVLPQKEIKMTRNHFDSALSKIAPTFKIGPVLVDPGSIRMPLPNQGNIAWSWGFKENYSSWLDEDVEDADQSAKLRKGRLKAWEGWLKLDPIEESD